MRILHSSCLLVILGFIVFLGCKPQEEVFSSDPGLKLLFSSDTVSFDTLFTGRLSYTQRLKVYNPNANAILIDKISLAKEALSPFDVTINGEAKISLEDQALLGGDSMLILVDVLIAEDEENMPFLLKDSIVFRFNEQENDVKLIAYGENATVVKEGMVDCDAIWTSVRPYIIQDTLLVDTLCTLTLEKGTRVYFDNEAALIVQGTLIAEGDTAARILFRNSRLDRKNTPGEWAGIRFLSGSKNHSLDHVIIRNADTGIRIEGLDEDELPDLSIKNTVIENMLGSGIEAISAEISFENVLINHCETYLLDARGGGSFTFKHCSFIHDFFGLSPALNFVDEYFFDQDSTVLGDIHAMAQNSIIWGSRSNEIDFTSLNGGQFVFSAQYNLLKTSSDSLTDTNILNEDPLFLNAGEYNYRLDSLSPAIDQGQDIGIELDLDGVERDELPDLGAYEYMELE